MAFYTRTEFCKLFEIDHGYLSTYIGRKKIILSGEFIDDAVQANADWIRKRKEKLGKKVILPTMETPKADLFTTETSKNTPTSNDSSAKSHTNYDLDNEIKQLQAQKARQDIENMRLKNEKLQGKLMPTDLVKVLFSEYTQSNTTSFMDNMNQFLQKLFLKKDFSKEEQAQVRGDIKDMVNNSINAAVDATDKKLENILKEFQNKKDVGERS